MKFQLRNGVLALILALVVATSAPAAESWPDLSRPAAAVGGGEHDVAVVVGIEGYGFVPPVPGAEDNAKAWYDYLTRTRGAQPANVKLLLGEDATREEILEAAQSIAAKAHPAGTLWFVFVGHGAPSGDGQDGLLVGVDAQQKAASLQKRSFKRQELLAILAKSRAGSISVILDACFSGRGQDGASIAPGLQPLVTVRAPGAMDARMVVLTAAKGNQFAGALPGTNRPAFSYLTLGALRGWASDKNGPVTAGAVWRYATGALAATLHGRNQTPDLIGKEEAVVGASAGETAPDLASLAKATAGGSGLEFSLTDLPAISRARAPKALESTVSGIDLGGVDVDALEKYDAVSEFDKGKASPEEKAVNWRALGKQTPKFAAVAEKRAAEWERFAAEWKAGEEATRKRLEARDADWGKLSRLLALKIVPANDKKRWTTKFVGAYLKSPGIEPAAAVELVKHSPAGPAKDALAKLAKQAPDAGASPARPVVTAGKAGIQWVSIPGGSFLMGFGGEYNTEPVHRVSMKAFEMTKTEVTIGQYKACVEVGVCSAPSVYEGGDEHPIVRVNWEKARTFSEWAGGHLPSEAEWEYAARSAGKVRKYPWGDEAISCEKALTKGCGVYATAPVCSKPKGNTEQGLCDMAGNAYEWVMDWYHSSYEGAPTDGSAWINPSGTNRIVRGGSWLTDALDARSFYRLLRDPTAGDVYVGFRLAR